jgi:hypothetical protein
MGGIGDQRSRETFEQYPSIAVTRLSEGNDNRELTCNILVVMLGREGGESSGVANLGIYVECKSTKHV